MDKNDTGYTLLELYAIPPKSELKGIVEKLAAIELKAPGCLKEEMFDFTDIILFGAMKYQMDNWLRTDGTKSSHKDMHASIFRHIAESSAGKLVDHESGLHPLLHAICREVMHYTRVKRGIKHVDD